MESPNHYELLCVTPEATADEIRAAYRRLIRVYHPDVASPAGAAMTLRLNDAQRELLDPVLRAGYDRSLSQRSMAHAGMPGSARQPQQPRYSPPPRPQSAYRGAPRTRRAEVAWHPGWFGFWLAVMFASVLTVLVSTAIVFVHSYTAPLALTAPQLIPPIVVALAWVVGASSRPSPLLIALMVIGAAIWPLTDAGVEPFTVFASLPTGVLPSLTIVACAVVALRISAPRATTLSRGRPAHRASAA